MTTSRISRFYKLSISERRAALLQDLAASRALKTSQVPLCQTSELPALSEAEQILNTGGLALEAADKIVENVIGLYSLPFGVALNAVLNGQDRLIPMVVEEPSVIAAASNAARMIREGGGFHGESLGDLMIAQVEIRKVPSFEMAQECILKHKEELLSAAAIALPGLVRRGAGPRDLVVRQLAADHLVVHLLIDCGDAMGANLVNTAAEAISERIAELAGGAAGLRILSNLTDQRRTRVRAKVPVAALVGPNMEKDSGGAIAVAIEEASIFAERDAYRAATHNKGIMNGLDSVVIATGNDYRAVEAGAHAYACRDGRYAPLATWRARGEFLEGEMVVPLALGVVGGTLRVHPSARLALGIAEVTSAADLAQLAASAGLASNLAALRALATEGIQRGHMSLHARSVAIAAGAIAEEVELVASQICSNGQVNQRAAELALHALRAAAIIHP